MSTYFSQKIGYLIEDFLNKKFDFQQIKKDIIDKLSSICKKKSFGIP